MQSVQVQVPFADVKETYYGNRISDSQVEFDRQDR